MNIMSPRGKAPSSDFPLILPLNSPRADLRLAGGKGASLARLIRAGFPVPGGFVITTCAYMDFISANDLDEKIQAYLMETGKSSSPEGLESASKQIRSAFSAGKIPCGLADEITRAYQNLSGASLIVKVAVRSSATAEDLPDLSFAGQQETFLNVLGQEHLMKAVVDCWSSLWTARAIGYRVHNNVPHTGAALAVVVQEMVESQVSGVLFTANPLTGLRSEAVIDAAFGLGEALVSGQVEPDHYVVELAARRILTKTLGAKEVSIHGQAGGGTQVTHQLRGAAQALPDEQILALARLGSRVADLYGAPQDIEWAYTAGGLFLLQARPVTSLFPVPGGFPARPLKVFTSFAAVQGMLDPLTPIGLDTLREVFAAGSNLFGLRVTRETQGALYTAGERFWANITPLLGNSVGRRVVPVVLSMVEPAAGQAVGSILDDPDLKPVREGISLRARLRLARFAVPLAANVLSNLAAPRRRREYVIAKGEHILASLEADCASIQGDRWQRLENQAGLLPKFASEYFPQVFIKFVSLVVASMASWNLLRLLAERAVKDGGSLTPADATDLVLQVTRGMPNNPTTEMDLALWEIAREILKDPASRQGIMDTPAAELSADYLAGKLPAVTMQAVNRFLGRYGGRGFCEIDLGRRRWADDPTHVFEMISSFTKIKDESKAPDVIFSRGEEAAREAVTQLVTAVRRTPHGWLRSLQVRFLANRVRQLMGARESPKFFVVRLFWIIQRELLRTGREFVQAGDLEHPDDLVYLSISELKAFASRAPGDWRGLIQERRSAYQKELLRRQVPRLLLSDGRAFYEGMSAGMDSKDAFNGSPVSPGSVEGRVRVVLDPSRAGLQPGEILVCPGTDPSWTPLFLSAAGLVMEVGGMMTHGAVVAREYGIPAIVGVDRATSRLQTGQVIRMNGSTGEIFVVKAQAVPMGESRLEP